MKRGVTELVTPGVSYNDNVLDQRSNNFLCSLHFGEKSIGISFLDISTGEFLITQGNELYIKKLVKNFGADRDSFERTFEIISMSRLEMDIARLPWKIGCILINTGLRHSKTISERRT